MGTPVLSPINDADSVVDKGYADSLGGGGSAPWGATGYTENWEFHNALTGLPIVAANTGTSAATAAIAGEPTHPGIIRATTGTTATGRAAALGTATAYRFGGGQTTLEIVARIPTISTGTETFTCWIGFIDQVTADPIDGIYVKADPASGQWQGVCSNNSTRTTLNLGSIVANTWERVTAIVNAAGTSVEWFADGVSMGTITTNIPTAAARETGIGYSILKTVGTTARTLDIDVIAIKKTLTR